MSDPIEMTADPRTKGIVGIQNMGNTCYCNSALQMLRACPDWTAYCLSQPLPPPENDPHRRVLNGYRELLQSLWSAYFPAYVRPSGFLHELRQSVQGTPYEMFALPIPNDSHEYLVYLLDQFHEALRDVSFHPPPYPLQGDPITIMRARAANGWNQFVSKNHSVIVDLFFGMMRTTIRCTTCQTETYQWEVFNSLKIPCEGATFMEWIHSETRHQTELTDYQCDTCKERRTAIVCSHVWRLPLNLFITLRRFSFDGQKRMTPCPYDGAPLCLETCYAPESDDPHRTAVYELRGVSDHHGTHLGGHYTAQFCHPLTREWWWMDDERAQRMEYPLLGASNYILYFRRL